MDRHIAVCAQRRRLDLDRVLGDRDGEAWTWDSLGYAHHHLGSYTDSRRCYCRSLVLLRELGDRYSEAEVLDHLADSHRAAGDLAAARDAWHEAIAILDDLQHPDRKAIRSKLRQLPIAVRAQWLRPMVVCAHPAHMVSSRP